MRGNCSWRCGISWNSTPRREPDWLKSHLPPYPAHRLRLLDSGAGGFAVDRLTHSLQTAHRAEEDGRDDAYIVCALVHDIGDTLTPLNHADLGAAIVKPWVPESYHWMVKHHDVFQGYYFWHYFGLDRNARDVFKSNEFYEAGKEFVDKYDMLAFDPDYPTPPLTHYETLLRGFFVEPADG